MSKKYRFKIDTPWGKIGDLMEQSIVNDYYYNTSTLDYCKYDLTSTLDYCKYDPSKYPMIFEEVIEKTPLDIVVSWLRGSNVGTYPVIAQKLLNAGLDPEKLK